MPKAVPRGTLFVGVVVVQIVAPHLRARQLVVLAPIDDIQRDTHRLHQRAARAAEIVERPDSSLSVGQHQRVVVLAVVERSLPTHEAYLPVADLLAGTLLVHVPVRRLGAFSLPATFGRAGKHHGVCPVNK
ncbi:MAG: hypothetical protein IPO59_15205 [Betaproteobacteria bacterium]|nr:hypothetical protein [Betaproteobacteria bacterium]